MSINWELFVKKERGKKWKPENYEAGIKGTQVERKFLFRVRFL